MNYNFDASTYADGMVVHSPVTDGLIKDFDWLEQIWEQSMVTTLKAESRDTAVMLTEKVYNPSSSRQR